MSAWYDANPDAARPHTANRAIKNPNVWREQTRRQRARVIEMLGGECIVCGVTNVNWLHADYIPTCHDLVDRHPRTQKFVREHIEDFRLLCANHHYELTITGRIDGTNITQQRKTQRGIIPPPPTAESDN